MTKKKWTQEEIEILTRMFPDHFAQMDNVASQGQLMVGMGIISQEEKQMIEG